jgi:FMN phosphatase YigB (HAD superfamily)
VLHELLVLHCLQVVGKPQPSFFQLALDDLQVTPQQDACCSST